jgi:hypothetical protein
MAFNGRLNTENIKKVKARALKINLQFWALSILSPENNSITKIQLAIKMV